MMIKSKLHGVIHLDLGGPEYTIVIGGKRFTFEDHRYCGPMPTDKRGNGRDLGERHVFWTAVTFWYQQGKAFNEDGTCKWVAKTETDKLAEQGLEYRHVIGKHYELRRIGDTGPGMRERLLSKAKLPKEPVT